MGKRKVNPEFCCQNTIIPNNDTLEMLGVTVDDLLKFDKQVANICRKLCLNRLQLKKRMRNILPYTLNLLFHISITVHRPGISVIRLRLRNWKK